MTVGRRQLTALVIGTSGFTVDEAARRLQARGHRTVVCQGPRDRMPCERLRGGTDCPLDEPVDVAVVIRGRPLPDLRPSEVGAICALRDGVPLVVAGRTALHPFGACAAAIIGPRDDLAATCEATARAAC